jgi:hypothetical protein
MQMVCELVHTTHRGSKLYRTPTPDEEEIMRSLIESLTPEACGIDWKWIGAMFAFYVAVVVIAAGLLMTHRSTKGSAYEMSLAAIACASCTLAAD